MSGLHLVKKGREHRKMDLQRDFTVASPAEFVTRFGGNRVIEKVAGSRLSALAYLEYLGTVVLVLSKYIHHDPSLCSRGVSGADR